MDTKPEKPKRTKVRFTTKEQIISKIDKFAKKAAKQRELQRGCYLTASRIREDARRTEDSTLLTEAQNHERRGDGWGKKADRLENKVLASLKRKLAEFQTDTIPGIDIDKSVEGL